MDWKTSLLPHELPQYNNDNDNNDINNSDNSNNNDNNKYNINENDNNLAANDKDKINYDNTNNKIANNKNKSNFKNNARKGQFTLLEIAW